jgi:NitT/TauT family transport system ATP-binding protein
MVDTVKELKTTRAAAGAYIRLSQISHAFDTVRGSLPVLENVSLDIQPGEFVALLGPSGCGKSSLLRLVAGLEPPIEGYITHNGDIVARPDPSRIVVFQDPTLLPWRTVRDNIALGLQARNVRESEFHRVDEALVRVGLSEFADSYPHQLSGGMAQRAALARALVNDPELLILDEPLGKLDSLTRLSMQSEILKLWQQAGFSVLMVTHDVEEALFLANRVVVFSPRPAKTVAQISVDLPYPRHRGQPQFVALRQKLLSHLGLHDSL